MLPVVVPVIAALRSRVHSWTLVNNEASRSSMAVPIIVNRRASFSKATNYTFKRRLEALQKERRTRAWASVLPGLALATNTTRPLGVERSLPPYQIFFGRLPRFGTVSAENNMRKLMRVILPLLIIPPPQAPTPANLTTRTLTLKY